MSMNLHAKSAKGDFGLWQTPTWVTYACLINENGEIKSEVKGKAAKRALYIYLQWFSGRLNGIRGTLEELESRQAQTQEHISNIISRMEERSLKVYLL